MIIRLLLFVAVGDVVGCMSAVNAQMSRDGLLAQRPLRPLVSERALEGGAHCMQLAVEEQRKRIRQRQKEVREAVIPSLRSVQSP